jgi:small subunit ribosomal protein S21|tara:strand:+ start:183 stop:374 length:192 start_codon:yes stop_codon:yes gene_type:complete
MLKIPVIKDNINRALKTFKIKFKKTGTLNKIREYKQFTKKSEKRKLAKEKSILKQKYREENDE